MKPPRGTLLCYKKIFFLVPFPSSLQTETRSGVFNIKKERELSYRKWHFAETVQAMPRNRKNRRKSSKKEWTKLDYILPLNQGLGIIYEVCGKMTNCFKVNIST